MYEKPKVNVLLDTNIWIYLANGNEQLSHNKSKSLHFELFKELKQKQDDKKIEILISDINLQEWARNKIHVESLIKKRKATIIQIVNEYKNYCKIHSEEENIEAKINYDRKINELEIEIKDNEEHINSVETFLNHECTKIPISDTTKIKVWELAISKSVPFHNNKNNFGDATLFFSALEYISSDANNNLATIFVSNNTKDFCENGNKDKFHPELQKSINHNDFRFECKLDIGLAISKEIQDELEQLFEEAYLDRISFNCKSDYCIDIDGFCPFGYLDKKIRVVSEYEANIDPNQLSLFPELTAKRESSFVARGNCTFCGSIHIECPVCSELIPDIEYAVEFTCKECNANMVVQYNDIDGELEAIVKDELQKISIKKVMLH